MSEWDLAPAQVLLWRMEQGDLSPAPVWTDLRTLPWKKLAGKVDVLTAGFPCQPFSTAGKRKGVKDPRHLWPYIERAIKLVRPRVVFFENVQGILSSKCADGTPVALHVLQRLEALGYKTTAGVFSASECGHPQQRKRVFFVGVGLADADNHGYIRSCLLSGAKLDGLRRDEIEREEIRCETEGRGCDVPNSGSAGLQGSEREQGQGHVARPGSAPAAQERVSRFDEQQHNWEYERSYEHKEAEAYQSPVGCPADGDSAALGCSIEELNTNWKAAVRACGNGVVPDTAELAFRTLLNEMLAE